MQRPSKTAELVCAARATHTLQYDNPVYFDPLAVELCGRFWKLVAKYKPLTMLMNDVIMRKLVAIVPEIILRAKFCEDVFNSLVQNELRQLVVLGAGYDSFAYRDDFPTKVKVFEVDLEITQNEKRARLAKIHKDNLPHVTYVPLDLKEQSLEEGLESHGFDFSHKTLVSWFGVTYYIDRDTFLQSLKIFKRTLASGSAVIFDFLLPQEDIPDHWKPVEQRCANFVAKKGEPWSNRLNENELQYELERIGFSEPEILMPEVIEQKYVAGREDFVFPHIMCFCMATVT